MQPTIATMEQQFPGDGIAFSIPPLSGFSPFGGNSLVTADPTEITAAQAAPFVHFRSNANNVAIAARNNISATDTTTCMWADDACWAIWASNAQAYAKASHDAGYEFLFIDTEAYNLNIWDAQYGTYAQVYARGQQLGSAIEAGWPGAPVMFMFAWSIMGWFPSYATLPAFLDGWMNATTGPITDGNEGSYYDWTAAKLAADAAATRAARRYSHYPLVYDQRVKVGFGLWVASSLATATTYRAVVCAALKKSDTLVWIYNETEQWWNGTMPAAYVAAVADGRALYRSGQACQ